MLQNWLSELIPMLLVLLLLVAVDLILGVLQSLKEKTFSWSKLSQYCTTNLPLIVSWLAADSLRLIPEQYTVLFSGALSGWQVTGLSSIGTVVYATVAIGLLGSILRHLAGLGVLKLPDEKAARLGLQ